MQQFEHSFALPFFGIEMKTDCVSTLGNLLPEVGKSVLHCSLSLAQLSFLLSPMSNPPNTETHLCLSLDHVTWLLPHPRDVRLVFPSSVLPLPDFQAHPCAPSQGHISVNLTMVEFLNIFPFLYSVLQSSLSNWELENPPKPYCILCWKPFRWS